MSQRLSQVSGHITNSYGRGLLAGEVAIITGELSFFWVDCTMCKSADDKCVAITRQYIHRSCYFTASCMSLRRPPDDASLVLVYV